ncbi:MAG: SGNH/GDSL hydrolase family protein [Acutalibacteraceae bacterium]
MSVWFGYSQEGLKLTEKNAVFYNAFESPIRLYGLPQGTDNFHRLPDNIGSAIPEIDVHYVATAGVRARFKTDSAFIAVRVKHKPYNFGCPTISKNADCGFDLYKTVNGIQEYVGTFTVPLDTEDGYESFLKLSGKSEEYTVYFPYGREILSLEIGLEGGAKLSAHSDYKTEKPIVFCGSSITQGFAASRAGNIYEGFVSRELDCDFIDLGFAGSCKGQTKLAEYIAGLDMTALVLDYDHNAPNAEFLKSTHENFFKIIRQKNPTVPILILSMPDGLNMEQVSERRAIIAETYVNAAVCGDKNVFFLDGSTYFPKDCFRECTVDGTHPNDLGMYFMARAISKQLSQII